VLDHKGEERRGCGSRLDQRERTFRYSTVKDPLGGSTDKERRGRGEKDVQTSAILSVNNDIYNICLSSPSFIRRWHNDICPYMLVISLIHQSGMDKISSILMDSPTSGLFVGLA
jgi:hypothetical protein